jgi:hypothetical protein
MTARKKDLYRKRRRRRGVACPVLLDLALEQRRAASKSIARSAQKRTARRLHAEYRGLLDGGANGAQQ